MLEPAESSQIRQTKQVTFDKRVKIVSPQRQRHPVSKEVMEQQMQNKLRLAAARDAKKAQVEEAKAKKKVTFVLDSDIAELSYARTILRSQERKRLEDE